ncbi:MAG: MotA/TolQ/ExbB proton channel family protein [Deltaproteobacteria bacterium]|nr:MotA/TolQ/ExbB proton channel family protein [Deltaproteobacteria bacterium]
MIGQALCALLILAAIFLVEFTLKVTEMGWASNLNALMIVLGGTFFATLIAYPREKLVLTARLLKGAFSGREEERGESIQTLVNLARIYRNGDIRNLEKQIPRLPQGLLKVGVELIAYRYSRDEIEQMLRREALATLNQYATAHKILHNMARLAPALGLAGTIVSLIRIFGHIQDPQNLIGYMAVALLCTFYGVILANLCFMPLSNKLRETMDQDELRMDMIQEGILDLYDHQHPKAIQYKLETMTRAIESENRDPARPKLVLMSAYEKARGANG